MLLGLDDELALALEKIKDKLSFNELSVIWLCMLGLKQTEIAERLHLSDAGVHKIRKNIANKLSKHTDYGG